jgi:hypothetical protein
MLVWGPLNASNAILIAATPVVSGTANPGRITGPGSSGNVLDETVTYNNRNDAKGTGLNVAGELVLIARDVPKEPAESSIKAGSAILDISSLVPDNQLVLVLAAPDGKLRLLAADGTFRFKSGSAFPGGITTLNPDVVKVFIGDVSITATRDELAQRAAISGAQQSALSSASADARQSFGTDSVTQQIDMGFAGDVGVAATMGHTVPLEGEIVKTPDCVSEAKGGLPCK